MQPFISIGPHGAPLYYASLRFADDVPLLAELLLSLVAFVLVLLRPRLLEGPLRRAWRALRRVGRTRAVVLAAVVATVLGAGSMAWLGFPEPRLADEHGHLLIADTFAHGRASNPTPRVPEAFEAGHVIVRPTYTAKYPPALGALLAVGELLGHPGVGLCLAAGLLAAVACWFLRGWLPPPWPLLGALLLAVRVGVGSYWGQSYWGGVPLAVGAMLVLGALPRMQRSPRRLPWLALGVGVGVIVASRPLEGLLLLLPAGIVALVLLARHWPALRRGLVPLAGVLAVGAAATLAYDEAVTGHPLRLPYQLHIATYGVDALSPWVAPPPPPPAYSSPVLANHYLPRPARPSTPSEATTKGVTIFAQMAFFVGGVPLLLFSTLAVGRLHRRRSQRGWKLFALGCALLPALLHSVTAWWSPHYSAAASGPLLLLALLGMREVAAGRGRWRRLAPWLAAAALLVRVPVALVELPAFRLDDDDPARLFARLERHLPATFGPSIVVVDDRLRLTQEWVCNRADLASASVLWIQDLGDAATGRVVAAYGPRRVFRLFPDGERVRVREVGLPPSASATQAP